MTRHDTGVGDAYPLLTIRALHQAIVGDTPVLRSFRHRDRQHRRRDSAHATLAFHVIAVAGYTVVRDHACVIYRWRFLGHIAGGVRIDLGSRITTQP